MKAPLPVHRRSFAGSGLLTLLTALPIGRCVLLLWLPAFPLTLTRTLLTRLSARLCARVAFSLDPAAILQPQLDGDRTGHLVALIPSLRGSGGEQKWQHSKQ